jgi:hypothetical protein
VLDLLFSCLLMVVFLKLKRQAVALARDVDEGTVTPADYTLLITQVKGGAKGSGGRRRREWMTAFVLNGRLSLLITQVGQRGV